MIENLAATSNELWMINHMPYFVALMTIAAESVIEKSSNVCGKRSDLKSKLLILSWEIFYEKGFLSASQDRYKF